MSATVAAALKKVAVYIFTDKKALKTVGGIVLGIIIIIVMPIVAVEVFSTAISKLILTDYKQWLYRIYLLKKKPNCNSLKIQ